MCLIEELRGHNYGNERSNNNAEYQEYLNNKVIPWLEKQGWQNLANSAKTCKDEEDWSEEDERLCRCLIKDQEKALDEVRNDKYGHSEIISDLKETYNERITWLKSLKEKFGCEVNCTTKKE